MAIINVDDAYILNETGAQVDKVTGLFRKAVRGELRTGFLRTFRISIIVCSCVHSHGVISPFLKMNFVVYNNCRH